MGIAKAEIRQAENETKTARLALEAKWAAKQPRDNEGSTSDMKTLKSKGETTRITVEQDASPTHKPIKPYRISKRPRSADLQASDFSAERHATQITPPLGSQSASQVSTRNRFTTPRAPPHAYTNSVYERRGFLSRSNAEVHSFPYSYTYRQRLSSTNGGTFNYDRECRREEH